MSTGLLFLQGRVLSLGTKVLAVELRNEAGWTDLGEVEGIGLEDFWVGEQGRCQNQRETCQEWSRFLTWALCEADAVKKTSNTERHSDWLLISPRNVSY